MIGIESQLGHKVDLTAPFKGFGGLLPDARINSIASHHQRLDPFVGGRSQ